MEKITRAKWNKLHKDYKSKIKGVPHILKNVDGATRLVPVEIVKEDVSYLASKQIGDIKFRVVDKLDTLQYALIPKSSKDLDKIAELKEKYNYSDTDIQRILADHLSRPGMDLEVDNGYRGAGYGLKLVKPKLR